MALIVYRDVAAADGCDVVAELVFRCIANGFTYVSHSTGSGGARSTSQPANAAALATALRTAPSSWVCWSRGNRKWSLQRATTANPDYTSWKFEYTATGALTTGSATAPDRNSTDSQYASGNNFRVIAPSTGGVAEAMKCHIIVDDATATFFAAVRRTPFPAGNNGFFSAIFCDQLSSPVWAANPEPIVCGNVAANVNTTDAALISGTTYSNAWLGYGTGSPAWTNNVSLENPGLIAGSTTSDRSGIDLVVAARWVSTAAPAVLGTSRLFELLQPGRTPTVGLDAGATLTRACFWTVAVLNDGVALTS